MERSTQYMIGGLLGLMILVIALLSALGRETTEFIAFIGGVIIPSIVALFARDEAKKAKVASEQAVKNTNGRMSELIQTVQRLGGTVDHEKYADVMSPEQAAVTADSGTVPEPTPSGWYPTQG